MTDQSWRGRPKVIADDAVSQSAQRIAEHAAARALPEVQVVMHGGEPLLAGCDRLRWIITELCQVLDGTCRLDNADDLKQLEPYLPTGSGHVIITSRNQAC